MSTFSPFQPVFHVMGFSVTGRVLNGPEGEGVADAMVTLNNQIKGMQWSCLCCYREAFIKPKYRASV